MDLDYKFSAILSTVKVIKAGLIMIGQICSAIDSEEDVAIIKSMVKDIRHIAVTAVKSPD